jgi:ABC-2 type transport system ATP-binding protein
MSDNSITGNNSEIIIETRGLTKVYGSQRALDRVSIRVERGRIYGFVGRNGAGKTTLLRIISGLAFPTDGDYTLFGASDKAGITAARARMGTLIESPVLYPGMDALHNLTVAGLAKGVTDIGGVYNRFGLAAYGKKRVKNYSLGMKQRLAIAMAMIGGPEFLILDEPLNGLDPPAILEINEIIRDLSANGVTFLISSHILSELSRTATDFIFIDNGTLLGQKHTDQLGDDLERYYMELIGNAGQTGQGGQGGRQS